MELAGINCLVILISFTDEASMLNDEACILSAQRTTLRNFWFAIQSIDERFGKGYAQEHPELLGAFLQAIATENSALRHMAGLSETINELANS